MKIPFQVTAIINELQQKLPAKQIGFVEVPYLELWSMQVKHRQEQVGIPANHKHKMKIAYLSRGAVGLIEYINPYVRNKSNLQKLRETLLKYEQERVQSV